MTCPWTTERPSRILVSHDVASHSSNVVHLAETRNPHPSSRWNLIKKPGQPHLSKEDVAACLVQHCRVVRSYGNREGERKGGRGCRRRVWRRGGYETRRLKLSSQPLAAYVRVSFPSSRQLSTNASSTFAYLPSSSGRVHIVMVISS